MELSNSSSRSKTPKVKLPTIAEVASSQDSDVIMLPVRKVTNEARAKVSNEDSKCPKGISYETYRIVGDEVLNRNFDPGCWARALSEANGTEDAALSAYARIRAESLADEVQEKEHKEVAFEKRKLFAGAKNSPAQPPRESAVKVRKRQRSYVADFLYWQALLSLSGVGAYLVLLGTSAQPGVVWWPGWMQLVCLSLVLQILPLLGFAGSRLLIKDSKLYSASKYTALAVVAVSMLLTLQAFIGKPLPKKILRLVQSEVPALSVPDLEEKPVKLVQR